VIPKKRGGILADEAYVLALTDVKQITLNEAPVWELFKVRPNSYTTTSPVGDLVATRYASRTRRLEAEQCPRI
jgi:hypothetical protein